MAAALSDLERLQIRVALEDLNTAFCYHLDHDDVDALLELFVDDVYYTHGSRVSRSKAELEQVFRSRSGAQPRTSRHLYSGLKLDIESATRARGTSRLHDVRPVRRAAAVARDPDARRRFRRRVRARRRRPVALQGAAHPPHLRGARQHRARSARSAETEVA